MPIYEYRCKCGEEFEDLKLMNDKKFRKSKCPKCGKLAKLVPSLFGFVFDFKPGFQIGLDRYIDTKKQREDVCRELGVSRIT